MSPFVCFVFQHGFTIAKSASARTANRAKDEEEEGKEIAIVISERLSDGKFTRENRRAEGNYLSLIISRVSSCSCAVPLWETRLF